MKPISLPFQLTRVKQHFQRCQKAQKNANFIEIYLEMRNSASSHEGENVVCLNQQNRNQTANFRAKMENNF